MTEPGEGPVQNYSPEYRKMLDAVPDYMRAHDISEASYKYWKNEFRELFERIGKKFKYFEEGNENLVELGNKLILNNETAGYNIILNNNDMDVTNSEALVFYSCHISRYWHFGLLLAEMENEENVNLKPEQVSLGIRGSRVEYGGWKIVPEDETYIEISAEDTITRKVNVLETAEAVSTFKPRDLEQAFFIASFLALKTRAEKDRVFVPGSWEVNDIRGTKALAPLLENKYFSERFGLVISNLYHSDKGTRLLALRRKSKFENEDDDWKSPETMQNVEIVKIIAPEHIGP